MIIISQKALSYLRGKQQKANGYPCRIFLVAQHCHGAQFAYRFDEEKDSDVKLVEDNFLFIIEKGVLELYEGFQIELKSTFIMDKLVIRPKKERHVCSCKT
jgi:Fe-S cluster assembly iron-binding protein IscA